MRYKRMIASALFLLGLGLIGLQAQNVVTTAGGNASGSGGTSSYTVGQIFYSANTGTGGSVSQGVQHPYEISIVTGVDKYKGISLQCAAYPNPTADLVNLKVENYGKEKLSFLLYDAHGKLLLNKKIGSARTEINLKNFAPSVYYLKITTNNREIKTFKITKY
jgi:hypothetical protein